MHLSFFVQLFCAILVVAYFLGEIPIVRNSTQGILLRKISANREKHVYGIHGKNRTQKLLSFENVSLLQSFLDLSMIRLH